MYIYIYTNIHYYSGTIPKLGASECTPICLGHFEVSAVYLLIPTLKPLSITMPYSGSTWLNGLLTFERACVRSGAPVSVLVWSE